MFKKVIVSMLVGVLCFSATACTPTKTVSYYNDYYGMEIKMRDSWIVDNADNNMSLEKDKVKDIADMVFLNDESGEYANLIYFANAEEGKEELADISVYADIVDEQMSLEEAMGLDFESETGELEDGTPYEVKNEGYVKLNGRDFFKVVYISRYTQEVYYTKIKGSVISISCIYDSNVAISQKDADLMIKSIYIK